jgi:hypothetical protein
LDSILEYGIIPRSELSRKIVYAYINDEDRYDGKLDYSSFSVSFPNEKVFWAFRDRYPEDKWVILSIVPAVLHNPQHACEFYS